MLLENGRNVPVPGRAFRALFDDGPQAFIERLSSEGLWARADRDQLQAELAQCVSLADFGGAAATRRKAWWAAARRSAIPAWARPAAAITSSSCGSSTRSWTGTPPARPGWSGRVVVMIHTGSRDVGFHVGSRWMDRARAAWPKGLKHPDSKLYGLAGELADEYLTAMGTAARYAWSQPHGAGRDGQAGNGGRRRRPAPAWWSTCRTTWCCASRAEHPSQGRDAGARAGDLALIPGSMGDFSFVASGLGNADWLWSCSHGAGRGVRRQAVRRMKQESASGTWRCVTCAKSAGSRKRRRYKPIGPVLEAQEQAGLIRSVARLRPWVTFKA